MERGPGCGFAGFIGRIRKSIGEDWVAQQDTAGNRAAIK